MKYGYSNEITAKTTKMVSPQQRAANVNKAIKRQQQKLSMSGKTMARINKSKSSNPKIRSLRIKKLRAYQLYLRAAITLNTARVREILRPS